MKKRNVKNIWDAIRAFIIVACITVACAHATPDVNAMPEAEYKLTEELAAQGYSMSVISDEVMESIYGSDGWNGTGGTDGLLLDGSPAPNAECGVGAEMNANPTPVPTPVPTAVPTPEPVAPPVEDDPTPTAAPTAVPTAVPTAEPVKVCKIHDWYTESIKEATCVETGLMKKTCKECGYEEDVVVEKSDHDYKFMGETGGDCKTPSVETFTCAVCGDSYSEDKEALVHAFSASKQVLVVESCTTDGSKAFVCGNCGELKDEEIIPAKGHNFSETVWVVKKAGLFTDGYGEIRCNDCNTVRERVVLPAACPIPLWCIELSMVVVLVIALIFINKGKRKK